VYHRILVAIEHSAADATILDHVKALAGLTGAELLLVHVADGWVARNYNELQLRESEEMRDDRRYLEEITAGLQGAGLRVTWRLGMGDPASEILRMASEANADLIAMATHGHRGLEDLVRGTTVNKVRHAATIPVLLLRAKAQP
jgi:nucleotide-binding universal stress UspA family protein